MRRDEREKTGRKTGEKDEEEGSRLSAYSIPFPELNEATIADLGRQLAARKLTARRLTQMYLERIAALDRKGPSLRAVIETNPDALAIAEALDRERASGATRGPLHGIPLLLKDNIDTADRMMTTAGSLALVGARPTQDATVAARLRAAGAVLLGKANLSEWANFRSTHSSSGWSARGGQALNPYSLDRSPCGSSSGSATAVAASLAAAALGTETDGSIVCPSSTNGVVGIKPTVGLTSRAGVIPVAHSQDTVGPFARTVADAALLLGAIAGPDPRDPTTQAPVARESDYARFLDEGALRGARIGVAREVYFGYSPKADAAAESAIQRMSGLGAVIVDPADIPTAKQMRESEAELTVLHYEFKADLNAYLSGLGANALVHTLEEVITFNETHAAQEMPYFGQEQFIEAQAKGPLTDPAYLAALEENHRLSRAEGIDAVMSVHELDALVMPTVGPAWKIDLVMGDHVAGSSSQPAALAGYPAVCVPAGEAFGLPIGITLVGRAYSEPKLIALAYAFERATKARRTPEYRATTP
jgi:amidase